MKKILNIIKSIPDYTYVFILVIVMIILLPIFLIYWALGGKDPLDPDSNPQPYNNYEDT